MELYTKEGLTKLEKEKTNILFVLLVIQSIAWIIFVLGLVLSNYHTQIIFKIVVSIVFTILFIFSSIIFSKWFYLKKLTHEYSVLIKKDGLTTFKTCINEIKGDVITLPDGSRVREVLCSFEDNKRRFLISEIFDNVLPLNEEVVISVKFDYIVGFKDAK